MHTFTLHREHVTLHVYYTHIQVHVARAQDCKCVVESLEYIFTYNLFPASQLEDHTQKCSSATYTQFTVLSPLISFSLLAFRFLSERTLLAACPKRKNIACSMASGTHQPYLLQQQITVGRQARHQVLGQTEKRAEHLEREMIA